MRGVSLIFLFLLSTPCFSVVRSINFSGFEWVVSERNGGPGKGRYSTDTVSVDAIGKLHLKIYKNRDSYDFAEVRTKVDLYYGEYTILLSKGWVDIDRNSVFGFFNFPQWDLSLSGTNEIDIEISHWGHDSDRIVQFGLYPANLSLKSRPLQKSYAPNLSCSPLSLKFVWFPKCIKYVAACGGEEQRWSIFPDVPDDIIPSKPLPLFFNYWIFGKVANPAGFVEQEVIIDSFDFHPLDNAIIDKYDSCGSQ